METSKKAVALPSLEISWKRRAEERRGEERRGEENVKIETNSVIEVNALGNVTKLGRTEEKCVPCFTKAISNLQYYSQGNIKQRQTL